jgi:hypothetical protein
MSHLVSCFLNHFIAQANRSAIASKQFWDSKKTEEARTDAAAEVIFVLLPKRWPLALTSNNLIVFFSLWNWLSRTPITFCASASLGRAMTMEH